MRPVIILILLLTLCSFSSRAQWAFHHDFEAPNNVFANRFILDTTHNSNSWQIGKPQKTVFDSALTAPNAIVTDTLHSYATKDTSIFYIKVQSRYYGGVNGWFELVGFTFYYQLDIDTGEIAKVEIQVDSGRRWVDLLKEDITYNINWGGNKPVLSSSTNGWAAYNVSFYDWAKSYRTNKYPYYLNPDTTLIRFTFLSDSVQTNKDGWIIDAFSLHNRTESIQSLANNNLISIYPNPTSDYIYIKRNTQRTTDEAVSIYNIYGQEVLHTNNIPTNGYLTLNLASGIYTLRYANDKEYAVKQLVLQ